MSRLNTAQIRLLSFLALAPGTGFVDLVQLEQAPQIRAEDDLFVPSLVARGWAEIRPRSRGGVRITDAGRVALAGAGEDGGAGTQRRERRT